MTFIQTAQEFPIIMQICVFCIGACIGSFLNVCIFRIPKGESIARPPSHCKCGKHIKWFDNIPILSWFVLRGKARCCGGKIAFRYPLVEFITAILFLALWNSFSPAIAGVYMLFVSLMIFCTFVDIDTMLLPDVATVGGTIIGVVLSTIVPIIHGVSPELHPIVAHIQGFGYSIFGVIVASGLLYWIRLLAEFVFKREAMGEGDVILLGCVGAFCGWQGAIFALFGGSVLGCIIVLPIVLFKQMRAKDKDLNIEIPFGPWIAIGGIIYIFLANFTSAYISNFAQIFE